MQVQYSSKVREGTFLYLEEDSVTVPPHKMQGAPCWHGNTGARKLGKRGNIQPSKLTSHCILPFQVQDACTCALPMALPLVSAIGLTDHHIPNSKVQQDNAALNQCCTLLFNVVGGFLCVDQTKIRKLRICFKGAVPNRTRFVTAEF